MIQLKHPVNIKSTSQPEKLELFLPATVSDLKGQREVCGGSEVRDPARAWAGVVVTEGGWRRGRGQVTGLTWGDVWPLPPSGASGEVTDLGDT